MKQTLRDYLVFCDMDNTLLTAKEGIPSCHRTVIKLFPQLGGRGTVAPRPPPAARRRCFVHFWVRSPYCSEDRHT